MTVTINGGGPIGTMMAGTRGDGHIKGFVGDPHVHYTYNDTGHLAVGVAVGTQGTLQVIRDMWITYKTFNMSITTRTAIIVPIGPPPLIVTVIFSFFLFIAAIIRVADIILPRAADAVGHKSCSCLAFSNKFVVWQANTRQFLLLTNPLTK